MQYVDNEKCFEGKTPEEKDSSSALHRAYYFMGMKHQPRGRRTSKYRGENESVHLSGDLLA